MSTLCRPALPPALHKREFAADKSGGKPTFLTPSCFELTSDLRAEGSTLSNRESPGVSGWEGGVPRFMRSKILND